MNKFIHPEIADRFVIEKFGLHYANPKWSLNQVEMVARQTVWDKQAKESTVFKEQYGLCPDSITPLDELDRIYQLDNVLDDVLDDEEDF